MFDWNDLKYFLALTRHGSTLAAARALGVDASTVQRRIAELERCIGQPLVRREPTGYRLTAFGEAMRARAVSRGGAPRPLAANPRPRARRHWRAC